VADFKAISARNRMSIAYFGLKYAEKKGTKMQAASDLTQSAKNKMVDGLSELGESLQRSGSGNLLTFFNKLVLCF